MCGIAGVFNLKPNISIDKNLVKKFNEDLANRGPDQQGTINDKNFSFTHRRLSILGLKNKEGIQPVKFQNLTLTYNGEIYNYLELNKELREANINVVSNCDTETLIKYLYHHQNKKLQNLDGMFAFAVTNGKKLWLSRDLSGKKPLFYSIFNNQLFFSSSLKSLTRVVGKEFDHTALLFCLMYGNINFRNRTIYKNIYTVEPGTTLTIEEGSITPNIESFINIKPERKYYNLNFDDAKDNLKELLEKSVKKRLISEVPLGTYLSGGLDSTIITSIAKKYKEDLKTFSICYNDHETRENTYAKICSKYLGTDHTAIVPDFNTYQRDWQELILQKGAPLSTSNEVLIYKLAKEASKSLKVVLSGEGADELLSGYGPFSRSPHDFIRFILRKHLKNPISFDNGLKRAYGRTHFNTLNEHLQLFYRRYNEYELYQIFSPEINISDILEEIDEYYNDIMNEVDGEDLYTKYNYVLYKINMRSLLDRLDFNTMNSSLEARAPFLDKEVVDFCLNIPHSYKLKMKSTPDCLCGFNAIEISNRFDITKHILREGFKNDIPKEIITRPKQSFPVPHNLLYDLSGRKRLELKLNLLDNPLINKGSINEWFESYNSDNFAFKLWTMENFVNFLDINK